MIVKTTHCSSQNSNVLRRQERRIDAELDAVPLERSEQVAQRQRDAVDEWQGLSVKKTSRGPVP
jgi:hypothetical protein